MAFRTRTLIASGGVLLIGLGLVGCGSTDPGDAPAERKSFALSGKTLTIRSGNTSLELVPADVRRVEVTRHVDGWVVLGSGPDPRWRMQDDTLTLQVKCSALISNCASQHRVKVPRGVAVVVEGDNGKVVASGFGAPLTLRADNGKVTVRDSSGPLELESDNGGIVAERISAKSVSVQSDNGGVRLGFSSVPDLVDSRSDNGGITIDLPGGSTKYAVDAGADNGRVSVDVPRSDDSSHVVKARSDNGQITVRSAN
ncbi:DUF4097 family beta strand repeat-containing protein [Streptomyces sp. NBC_01217]|uniref:DUF4097 family beta strand repeat-containing protein n=1 Tax=Streptomyces sp. NBC_01217 TaxID=2903779 RepID=UPI002E0FD9D0|nr:DUF4097 domain-containing protein [Streptomyces sp. NBC_01217]